MLLAGDGGGTRRLPWEDEEDQKVFGAIERAGGQGRGGTKGQQAVDERRARETLHRSDPIVAIYESIDRVGGPEAYSRNVRRVQDSFLKWFRVPASPAVALDLGRVPANRLYIDKLMAEAAMNGYMMYRGMPITDEQTIVADKIAAGIWAGMDRLFYGAKERERGIRQPMRTAEAQQVPYGMQRVPEPLLLQRAFDPEKKWGGWGKEDTSAMPPNILFGDSPLDYRHPDIYWDIIFDYKIERAARVLEAESQGRVAEPTNWSGGILGFSGIGVVAKAVGLVRAEGGMFAPALLKVMDDETKRNLAGFLGAAGFLKDKIDPGLDWVRRRAEWADPDVVMATAQASPYTSAVATASMGSSWLTAKFMKQVASAALHVPDIALRGVDWYTQQTDRAGWLVHYAFKYSAYHQGPTENFMGLGVLGALYTPLAEFAGKKGRGMPTGTPESNPDDWRRFHEAQVEGRWSWVWDEAAQEVADRQPFLSSMLGEIGVDRERYPMTCFLADMAYYSAFDLGVGATVKAGAKVLKIGPAVEQVLKKTPHVYEIADVVAKETNQARIAVLTDIWRPSVTRQLKAANTNEAVRTILQGYVLDGGGITGGELLLKNQLKTKIRFSPLLTSTKVPSSLQRFFHVMPTSPQGLGLSDQEVLDEAMKFGEAWMRPMDEVLDYTDRLLGQPNPTLRNGIFGSWQKHIEETDPDGWARSLKRQDAYARPGVAPSGATSWAPHPVTGEEMSVLDPLVRRRTLAQELAPYKARLDYIQRRQELANTITRVREVGDDSDEIAQLVELQKGLVSSSDELIKGMQDELQFLDDLVSDVAVLERAKDMAHMDMVGQMNVQIEDFIRRGGGLRWDPEWGRSQAQLKAARMHGRPSMSTTEKNKVMRGGLWNEEIGADPGKAAQEIAGAFPESGITDSKSLYEWLNGRYKPNLERHMDEARALAFREQDQAARDLLGYTPEGGDHYGEYLRQIEAQQTRRETLSGQAGQLEERRDLLRAQVETPEDVTETVTPFADFADQWAVGEVGEQGRLLRGTDDELLLRQTIDALESNIRRIDENPGEQAVPLHIYQSVQYFKPEISLEHVYVAKSARGVKGVSVGIIPILDTVSRFPVFGHTAAGTPINLDLLVKYWKMVAIGSPGQLMRISMDEPARMVSRGYRWEAVSAWRGHGRSVRELEGQGMLAGSYSENLGQDILAWYIDAVQPTAHVAMHPTSPGYSSGFTTTMTNISRGGDTRAWAEGGREGLRQYYTHNPRGMAFRRQTGWTVEALVDTKDNYLFTLTHRRVDPPGMGTAMGELTPRMTEEWQAYERVVREGPAVRIAPPVAAEPVQAGLTAGSDLLDGLRAQAVGMPDDAMTAATARVAAGEMRPITVYISGASVTKKHGRRVGLVVRDKADLRAQLDAGLTPSFEVLPGSTTSKTFAGHPVVLPDDVSFDDLARYPDLLGFEVGPPAATPMAPVAAAVPVSPSSPAWFHEGIEEVREDLQGRFILYREQDTLNQMVRGTLKINAKNMRTIPLNQRPILNARPPRRGWINDQGVTTRAPKRLWGKVATEKEAPIPFTGRRGILNLNPWQDFFEVFGAVQKNVRSTLYAHEYRSATEGLKNLSAARQLAPDYEVIHTLADRKARKMVDFMTYTADRTAMEYALRDFVPFVPAVRDFMNFWMRESIRRPSRGLLFYRLQSMPDEASQKWNQDSMMGIGSMLTAVLGGTEAVFNPRTFSFFTGGSGPPHDPDAVTNWYDVLETQWPGGSPVVTMAARALATNDRLRDKFGVLPNTLWGLDLPKNKDWIPDVPGFELVTGDIPIFSRVERLWWGLTALLKWATGGTPKGWNLPGPFGRDPELRTRAVDYVIRYEASQRGWGMVTLTDEQKKELLQDAYKKVGKQEFAEGALGFMFPMLLNIRDAEERDIQLALRTYRDTFQESGEERTPQSYGDRGNVQSAKEYWEGANAYGNQLRDKVREEFPEYSHFFDYMDAMAEGDEEKFADLTQDYPDVVAYFVYLYDTLGEIDQSAIDAEPNSLEAWMIARDQGHHPLKTPETYLDDTAKEYAKAQAYVDATGQWRAFEADAKAKGWDPQSAEYIIGRAALRDKLFSLYSEITKTPERAYNKLGWERPAFDQLSKDEEAVKKHQAEVLAADYHDDIALLKPSDPRRDFLKRHYLDIFESQGLNPNLLTPSIPKPQAERTAADLVSFMGVEPWEMSIEDFRVRNIIVTPQTREYMARALEFRADIQDQLDQRDLTFWEKEAEPARVAYYARIRELAMSDAGFAASWNYYQTPKWERLRDAGTLSSREWDLWFDVLTQINTKIEQNRKKWEAGTAKQTDIQVFMWQLDKGRLTAGSATAANVAEQIDAPLRQWKKDNPEFAVEFERFPISFWNIERRW